MADDVDPVHHQVHQQQRQLGTEQTQQIIKLTNAPIGSSKCSFPPGVRKLRQTDRLTERPSNLSMKRMEGVIGKILSQKDSARY